MKSGLLQRRQTERFGAYEYNARETKFGALAVEEKGQKVKNTTQKLD